jgi:hypothetical protein
MNRDEIQNINYGILIGWLKALARINDKTNHGHEFLIRRIPISSKLESLIENIFKDRAEEYETLEIENPQAFLSTRINYWFYNFQQSESSKTYFLEDRGNNFSLTDEEWKNNWVGEFVNLLLETSELKKLYKIELRKIRNYYANEFDDMIIEGEKYYYHLHFSITD